MSAPELLVEVGCEEIPADWLDPAIAAFATGFASALDGAGLAPEPVRGHGTPRRLVAHTTVRERQEDRSETKLGPPARIGRTEDGAWTRAALGFARRLGVEADALRIVETARGPYVGVGIREPGRPALEVLPELLETALRGIPFPTAMAWDARIGGEPFPFGRPIRWIVALLGGEVIPFRIEVAGGVPVVAGRESRGHRFRSRVGEPGAPFRVDSFASLREGLRERGVVLDPEERRRELLAALAAAGGSGFELPERHHHLVEWPGAIRGTYDEDFRRLPEEIRRAVLVHHQKYLPVAGECAFLAVVNLPDDPRGAVRRGAERVVRARLRDAAFFWDEALRRPLPDRREELARVTFHQRIGHLGGYAGRVERLARFVAEQVGADPEAAGRAAALAKCDLTTSLVGEFPALQGEAGGRILEAQGEPPEVWRAVYDHYRPQALGSALPETVEGAVVALADRAATLAGLFAAGEAPSGSGDPFGLRRAALSLLVLLRDAPAAFARGGWPTPAELLRRALAEPAIGLEDAGVRERLTDFVSDRLGHALTRPGLPPGVAAAVLALRGADSSVADSWERILALADAVREGDYAVLAAAQKRARRILTPGAYGVDPDPALCAEPAERDLLAALLSVEERVRGLAGERRFREGFGLIAGLAPRGDAFFDEVLVMADDPALRRNRLAILARLDALFREIGDLGQIGAAAG